MPATLSNTSITVPFTQEEHTALLQSLLDLPTSKISNYGTQNIIFKGVTTPAVVYKIIRPESVIVVVTIVEQNVFTYSKLRSSKDFDSFLATLTIALVDSESWTPICSDIEKGVGDIAGAEVNVPVRDSTNLFKAFRQV